MVPPPVESSDSLVIEHLERASRFEARFDGTIGFLTYRRSDDRVYLDYVEVMPVWRGRGVAERLCRAALDWTRAQGLLAVPVCPYIVTYAARQSRSSARRDARD
jgi:predicted GNAT family acetyltransferase